MINPLIAIHAGLGELGGLAFLWVLVELLHASDSRKKRAQIVAWIGVGAFLLSWIIGGYYYVKTYGPMIKPVIKSGPTPWAHSIITETKEHIFLFLPFMAITIAASIRHVKTYKPILLLATILILTTFSMAAMGFLISSGYREALEVMK